jgi:hypothetical protein
MSSWVGEIRLGPRVVQPQGFLGRGQLVSLEETLEEQVTPLPQVRQATVGHPHPRTLSALAVRPQRHSTVQLLRVTAELAEIGLDISREFPKPLTIGKVQVADVVITMGCGDACPIYPGKRYEDWDLPDPAGLDLGRCPPDPR